MADVGPAAISEPRPACQVSTCHSQAQPGSCPDGHGTRNGRGLQGPQQRVCAPPTQALSQCPRRLQPLPGQWHPEQRRLCPQGGWGRGCQCPPPHPGARRPIPRGRGTLLAEARPALETEVPQTAGAASPTSTPGLLVTLPWSSCPLPPRHPRPPATPAPTPRAACIHFGAGGPGPRGTGPAGLCWKAEEVWAQPARRRGHGPSPNPFRPPGSKAPPAEDRPGSFPGKPGAAEAPRAPRRRASRGLGRQFAPQHSAHGGLDRGAGAWRDCGACLHG